MNALAEVLGMSLPGCAAIPAAYRQRGQMAYETGRRIVGMVKEDLRPSKIMSKESFKNAVVAAAALGASSNCPVGSSRSVDRRHLSPPSLQRST